MAFVLWSVCVCVLFIISSLLSFFLRFCHVYYIVCHSTWQINFSFGVKWSTYRLSRPSKLFIICWSSLIAECNQRWMLSVLSNLHFTQLVSTTAQMLISGVARNLIWGGVYVLTRSLQFQNMC